jgi:hypothetical protein
VYGYQVPIFILIRRKFPDRGLHSRVNFDILVMRRVAAAMQQWGTRMKYWLILMGSPLRKELPEHVLDMRTRQQDWVTIE